VIRLNKRLALVTVHHATEKRAKDAAREGGRGTPVKHTKMKKAEVIIIMVQG